jgi:DNA-binding SARP family transcriptional activator
MAVALTSPMATRAGAGRRRMGGVRELPFRRPGLRITTIGGFAVERAGRPAGAIEFERQKARSLLAALLCAGEPVHRERLLEWFWPEVAPERGLACLHTTLHAVRRGLEPELRRGAASGFLTRQGSSYRLELRERDRWDAGLVLQAAREASSAAGAGLPLPRLEEVEALCDGTFLPEWPYDDWSQGRRLQIQEASRLLTERLAEAQMAAGHPEGAASRYRRLLALEPERESWHRGLMRAYFQAGELGLALRQYDVCRTLLRRKQGSEPGRETRALYLELLRAEVERP